MVSFTKRINETYSYTARQKESGTNYNLFIHVHKVGSKNIAGFAMKHTDTHEKITERVLRTIETFESVNKCKTIEELLTN